MYYYYYSSIKSPANFLIPVVLVVFILISIIGDNVNATKYENRNCSASMLACRCENIETINDDTIRQCCVKHRPNNLVISGLEVKNLTIKFTESSCASSFNSLVIRGTNITKLYNTFKGLTNISNVYIRKNENFSDFHDFVFSSINKNISNIVIEANSLRSIMKTTFKNLVNLTTLKLFNNNLGYIEADSFVDLKKLKYLYLNNNFFTTLDKDGFNGLSNLEILDLTSNPLHKSSNDILTHLKNLLYLKMSLEGKMKIKRVGFKLVPKKFFFSSKKLRDLNMTLMKIENFTAETFYGLNNLKRLTVSKNLLQTIAPGTFQQVGGIESIDLSLNKLKCLYSDTFKSLPRLKNLNLFGNQLSYISEVAMSHLSLLRVLDIRENNIYIIENNAFGHLKSLMVLKLNLVLGKAHNSIDKNFMKSPLGKLSNRTQIVGMYNYFGLNHGYGQPMDPVITTDKNQSTIDTINNNICPQASQLDREWSDFSANGSRKHLLIIVGICVLFLLIALAIIMTYRAWSKHKMTEFNPMINGAVDPITGECGGAGGDTKSKLMEENVHMIPTTNGNDNSVVISKSQNNHKIRPKSANNADTNHDILLSSQNKRHSQKDEESSLTPLGVL